MQPFFYLGQDFDRVFVPLALSAGAASSPLFMNVRTSLSGQRSLSVLLSGSRGVLVEYFAREMFWTAPIYSDIANGIFPHEHYALLAVDQSLMIGKYNRVGVRWTGYLRVSIPQQLTFLLNASGVSTLSVFPSINHVCFYYDFNSFFRTFDDRIIMQTILNETATKQHIVHVAEGMYPIQMLHSIDGGQPSCDLQYMSNTMPMQPIAAPDITCCAQHLPGSPYIVKVQPSSPCAALSVIASATSIWTAGVVGTIDIAAKDSYGNLLNTWDNKWRVYMTSASPVAVNEFSIQPIFGGKDHLVYFRFDKHLTSLQAQSLGDAVQKPP
jgi:hypothetical protein